LPAANPLIFCFIDGIVPYAIAWTTCFSTL
jgi:hypothetical protein